MYRTFRSTRSAAEALFEVSRGGKKRDAEPTDSIHHVDMGEVGSDAGVHELSDHNHPQGSA